VTPDDEPALRALVESAGTASRYRYRGVTPGPAQFHADLWTGVLSQYVICRVSDPTPVGLASAFAPNLHDGHVHLGAFIDPAVRRRAWPAEAFGVFVEHLFSSFDLRKLYLQVNEHNLGPLGSLRHDLLVEEARLREHDYADGAWSDSVVFALWRDRWFDPRNRHRNLLLARGGGRSGPPPT
jgi:RimJ/RimL family protein N-acetyltransferase